ncbi:hypothetical protein D0867_01883 [Hortaea werneckii]|uniref:Uncharacterized protein n=1 Tax=Hortaea werneckii TaxID=91943 RepID=A0A3M7A8C4_HORWE|nr:hypothetical protein D0867_01883 [Hortaea werneckii]
MPRIALSFVLNYEEGGELSILEGDSHAEPYLWEKGSSGGQKEGVRYLNAEQDFEYGSRVGFLATYETLSGVWVADYGFCCGEDDGVESPVWGVLCS